MEYDNTNESNTIITEYGLDTVVHRYFQVDGQPSTLSGFPQYYDSLGGDGMSGRDTNLLDQYGDSGENFCASDATPRMFINSALPSFDFFISPEREISRLSVDPSEFSKFIPIDRKLPPREVTEKTIVKLYVQFILYCNPKVDLNQDTSELEISFKAPPKSNGTVFNIFKLFQLVQRLEKKADDNDREINSWNDLALALGVKKTPESSTQKVQQYAARLKRWMRQMHIDAFFAYCMGKDHPYYSMIPNPNDMLANQERCGVLREEDLALRALIPELKPKRGRKKNGDKDEDEAEVNVLGKRQQLMTPVQPPVMGSDRPIFAHIEFGEGDFDFASASGDPFETGLNITSDWPSSSSSTSGSDASSNLSPPDLDPNYILSSGSVPSFMKPATIPVVSGNSLALLPPSTTSSKKRSSPAVSSAWHPSGANPTGKRGRPATTRTNRLCSGSGPLNTGSHSPSYTSSALPSRTQSLDDAKLGRPSTEIYLSAQKNMFIPSEEEKQKPGEIKFLSTIGRTEIKKEGKEEDLETKGTQASTPDYVPPSNAQVEENIIEKIKLSNPGISDEQAGIYGKALGSKIQSAGNEDKAGHALSALLGRSFLKAVEVEVVRDPPNSKKTCSNESSSASSAPTSKSNCGSGPGIGYLFKIIFEIGPAKGSLSMFLCGLKDMLRFAPDSVSEPPLIALKYSPDDDAMEGVETEFEDQVATPTATPALMKHDDSEREWRQKYEEVQGQLTKLQDKVGNAQRNYGTVEHLYDLYETSQKDLKKAEGELLSLKENIRKTVHQLVDMSI